jgi:hypothetical protein
VGADESRKTAAMKTETRGHGLIPHFVRVTNDMNSFRVLTNIRTENEKFWGFVFRDKKDRNIWTNDRGDGRSYDSRMLAGRDLIERRF